MRKVKEIIYRLSQWLVRMVLRTAFGCRYHYEEPIPRGVPLIVASNHASYWDPPTVGAGVPRAIHFMAKRELFRNRFFGALIRFYHAVPIRRGGMDWKGVAVLREILASEGAVILFPEGTRSRDGRLGKPKFGVGMLAQETGAWIVPAYAHGTSRLKPALLRRDPMRVYYGRAIRPEQYADFEETPRGQLGISAMTMDRIAALQRAHLEASGGSTRHVDENTEKMAQTVDKDNDES